MSVQIRRHLVTGAFIWVPIILTVWAFLILLGIVNRNLSFPIGRIIVGDEVSAFTASVIGISIILLGVFLTGLLGSNLLGRQIFDFTEGLVAQVPVFNTVYSAVKQMTQQFSSKEKASFRKVVLVRCGPEGHRTLGFLTGEFSAPGAAKPACSVYIPTNHLWFGEIRVVPADEVQESGLSVEEGISYFLSCGAAAPPPPRGGGKPAQS